MLEENPSRTLTTADSTRPMAIILAEEILKLLKQSGATPNEQSTAIDIVQTLVLDRVYNLTPDAAESQTATL